MRELDFSSKGKRKKVIGVKNYFLTLCLIQKPRTEKFPYLER